MKNTFKLRILILMIGSLAALINSAAQEPTIISDSIFSKALNEQRKFKIYLPAEYRRGSDAKYDVVYILDGEMHLDDFISIYRFACDQKFLPPLILVALQNKFTGDENMGDRDFTPEKTKENANSGGADNFISFLKDELIPRINTRLPASGDNSLFGHSLGGLFAMYVLLKEPALFTNYYCSDPAFPWNDRRIIRLAEETFEKTSELDKTLWITGCKETYRNVGIGKMDSVLKVFAPKGLRWNVSVYSNETHMSVRFKGIYDGLKYCYDGYNSKKLVEFHPSNGSLLAGKPSPIFLNGSFPNVFYTTDGSEPDTLSRPAPQMIEISAPSIVTVKWIGENKKYITSAKGNFELSKLWPALQNVKGIKPGGLRYSYYEGKWARLPDFTRLKAAMTGIADSAFSLDKLPAKSDFGCVFEGYIKIESEGYYGFALCSSDGSKFFLGGHEIISNDGVHGSDWYKSYCVPLQKGFYPVRFEYFQNEGNRYMDIIYISPETHSTVNMKFKTMYYK
jgi:predicted alpha/beta superfamily hydrolase